MSDSTPYQELLDIAKYINESERPKAELTSMLFFLLSSLTLESDDLNDAYCDSFSRYEDVTLPRRAAKVTQLLDVFKRGA
jgi:hypothetical protein